MYHRGIYGFAYSNTYNASVCQAYFLWDKVILHISQSDIVHYCYVIDKKCLFMFARYSIPDVGFPFTTFTTSNGLFPVFQSYNRSFFSSAARNPAHQGIYPVIRFHTFFSTRRNKRNNRFSFNNVVTIPCVAADFILDSYLFTPNKGDLPYGIVLALRLQPAKTTDNRTCRGLKTGAAPRIFSHGLAGLSIFPHDP